MYNSLVARLLTVLIINLIMKTNFQNFRQSLGSINSTQCIFAFKYKSNKEDNVVLQYWVTLRMCARVGPLRTYDNTYCNIAIKYIQWYATGNDSPK